MSIWNILFDPRPIEFGKRGMVYNPWDLPRRQFIYFTIVLVIAASFMTFAGGAFVGTILGIGSLVFYGDYWHTFWIGFWTSGAAIAIPSWVPYLRLYFSKRARAKMLLKHTIVKADAKTLTWGDSFFAVSSNDVFDAMEESTKNSIPVVNEKVPPDEKIH
jgi:hypothetical protein